MKENSTKPAEESSYVYNEYILTILHVIKLLRQENLTRAGVLLNSVANG
jgi:hypothetical protein